MLALLGRWAAELQYLVTARAPGHDARERVRRGNGPVAGEPPPPPRLEVKAPAEEAAQLLREHEGAHQVADDQQHERDDDRPPGERPAEIAELDLEILGQGALRGRDGERDGLHAGAKPTGSPRRGGRADLL